MAENQNDFILMQAMSITAAQAGVRAMTAQEAVDFAREVADGIRSMQEKDSGTVKEPACNPKAAVHEGFVICLECGEKFKMLTKRHLAEHGLTPKEYRAKWGLKKRGSLACRSLQRMRRQKMQEMQLWTRRRGMDLEAGAE